MALLGAEAERDNWSFFETLPEFDRGQLKSNTIAGSMVMLAKGNRSKQVTEACKEYGGFYLGSIGGPAAILAQDNIKSVEVVAFEEDGMEAIRKIRVENFPAFIIVDDKGNDFFQELV